MIFIVALCMILSVNASELKKVFDVKHPFNYDLGLRIIPSKKEKAAVTICCHGYGHSNAIIDVVHSFGVIPDHVVSFNFPDYECVAKRYDPKKSTFGSINELLPLLYVIKTCVVDAKLDVINLYGFSAGGGALINALAVLNQNTYNDQLAAIGIGADAKKKIVDAVQKGLIVLDCPLKSIDEIMAKRGADPEFTILNERYKKNHMVPLDAIQKLNGMRLTILVHFQTPDEILGNRDDALFADRITAANKGKTYVVYGHDGGHNAYHASLWKEYKKLRASVV